MGKKIPTIFGLLMIFGLLGIASFGFNTFFKKDSEAATQKIPQNIQITNISDTGMTVTWITEAQTSGVVSVSKELGSTKTYYDERDTTTPGKYYTHSINIRNLTPETNYNLTLISDGKPYNKIQSATGKLLSPASPQYEPAYGSALFADNKPANGSLVYLTMNGSQILSTLVKESGSWLIPLANIRTINLNEFLTFQERSDINLIIKSAVEEASAKTDSLNDSPVPVMIVGKEYDFRKQQAQKNQQNLAKIISPSQSPSEKNTDVLGTTNTVKPPVFSLLQPADGASLVSTRPMFTGTGIPGKKVVLTTGSQTPATYEININENGKWDFTPEKPFGIGKNTATATSFDDSNKPIAISVTFNILKSGTQVLGDATPSATLEPTITTEITPESSLAGQPPPVSGSPLPLILLIILGGILLLGGLSSLAFS